MNRDVLPGSGGGSCGKSVRLISCENGQARREPAWALCAGLEAKGAIGALAP